MAEGGNMGRVIHGDCLEVLRTLESNSVEALITDPPAGIAFMGRDWDHHKGGMLQWVNWLSEILSESLRVMKPGALGLVWSIPRTSHWTGLAIELAGFRIIDIVHHCQGSGFPKGQDIGKLIDGMAGAEREVVGKYRRPDGSVERTEIPSKTSIFGVGGDQFITAPATPEAQQWDGWKTPALKPAVEGWWLAQKPCEGTITRNVLKWGVGGLNVEAGRVGFQNGESTESINKGATKMGGIFGNGSPVINSSQVGRYPANLILSCGVDCDGDNHAPDCPVEVIGRQSGECKSGGSNGDRKAIDLYFKGKKKRIVTDGIPPDTGTAARYFKQLPFDTDSIHYSTKASPSDRSCYGQVENVHPTVKSRHLMEYFAKLITPPGGVILDPFGGSGSTALGAIRGGFDYVLIEQSEEFVAIARQRIATLQPHTPTLEQRVEWLETQVKALKVKQRKDAMPRQLSLFDEVA